MNATYKVVFNKARGALMVVNEITSMVQSKGSKTVVAAAVAVAAVLAGVTGTATASEPAPAFSKTTVVIDGSATPDMVGEYAGMDFEGYVSKPFGKDQYESGAVYIADQKVGFKPDVKFINNTSERAGGALELQNADVVLVDAVITGNKADTWGGAIRTAGKSRLTIFVTKDTVYSDNRANVNLDNARS